MSNNFLKSNFLKNMYNYSKLSLSIWSLSLLVLIGSACNEVTAPPDVTAPDTPQDFILFGGGDGQARFRWTKSNEPDLQFYRLYRSVNNFNNYSVLIETGQNEYLDRFLSYDSTYYYYLVAVDNNDNESEETEPIMVKPVNISAPLRPTFLIANAVNNPIEKRKHINLSWSPPDAGDLAYFKIYRGTESSFEVNQSSLIDSTDVGIYFDSFPQINTRYHYKITAVDLGNLESSPSTSSSDLIVNSAQLISPSNLSKFTSPFLFQWTVVDSALAYKVFVGNSPFSDVIWESGKVKISEATYKGPKPATSKVYYWWVGAYSKEIIILDNGSELEAQINSYSSHGRFVGE